MKATITLLVCLSIQGAAFAGPRTSTNYSITTDATDSGGAHTASAAYSSDGSIGAVAGVSTVSSPTEVAKSGYIGQLFDVVSLQLNSVSLSVNETATLQLTAQQLLDDASFLAVNANSVTWSVVSGPISGVDTNGLATAAAVYQNTTATVQGVFTGLTGTLDLTIVDSIPDNYGSYAGDGIDDSWQVHYFGLPPNPLAGPNVDADGTGQTNLFKFIAGLDPTDPTSRFTLTIQPVPGQAGQKNLIFSPVVAGRTYAITAKTNLITVGGWSAINASAPSDVGTQRTITDLSATDPNKFYRVEITKP